MIWGDGVPGSEQMSHAQGHPAYLGSAALRPLAHEPLQKSKV